MSLPSGLPTEPLMARQSLDFDQSRDGQGPSPSAWSYNHGSSSLHPHCSSNSNSAGYMQESKRFHACDADVYCDEIPSIRPRSSHVPHQGPAPPKVVHYRYDGAPRRPPEGENHDEHHQDHGSFTFNPPQDPGSRPISVAYQKNGKGNGSTVVSPNNCTQAQNYGHGESFVAREEIAPANRTPRKDEAQSAEFKEEHEGGGGPAVGPDRLEQVQQTLSDIFDYYIPKRAEPKLTCARFKRVCEDSRLIDKNLSSAQVDVTFAQVCRGSPHMTLAQFRDGIVRLAAAKYPSLPRLDAVWRIYEESLSSFASEGQNFEEVDSSCLAVLSAATPSLETLYKGYFPSELSRVTVSQPRAAAFQQAEQGFVQVLADFEVVPGLVGGAVAHAVFRKVTESRRIPEDIVNELQGQGRVMGRNFTFSHFALALALAAGKCFADAPALALHRLFEWMDSSKGRVVFSTACPGLLPPGASFRLAAPWFFPSDASLAAGEEFRSTLRSGTVSLNSSGRLANSINNNTTATTNNNNNNTSTASSLQDSFSPASNADLPGRSRSSTSNKHPIEPAGGARRKSLASRGVTQRIIASLSADAKRVASKIFAHYASFGDPLNRCKLNSLKFQRLLRDCGILKLETSENFTPPTRRARSSSLVAARRDAEAQDRDPAPSDLQLPLRVFPKPFLAKVEADLIFVQAVKQQGLSTRGTPPSRPPNGTLLGTSGDSGASKLQKGTHMGLDAFLGALAEVATRCRDRRGERAASELSLEELCLNVLLPLLEIHEGSLGAGEDSVQAVAEAMRQPATTALIEHSRPGLERLFRGYAVDNGRFRPHWDAESLVKFCQEFEMYDELAYLSLQRIFQDCVQQENFSSVRNESESRQLSFSGFTLALGMLSYKVYMGTAPLTPTERLSALFSRINNLASLPGLSARLGVHQEPLLPLPRSQTQQRRSCSSSLSSSAAAAANRPRYSFASSGISKISPGEMSWAALMHAN